MQFPTVVDVSRLATFPAHTIDEHFHPPSNNCTKPEEFTSTVVNCLLATVVLDYESDDMSEADMEEYQEHYEQDEMEGPMARECGLMISMDS